ncbi:hypothetical protein L3V82_13215, partial [Thiotrichales bacterium 19S3-7]|nr:hypothetical protein [Thiotrichales bacterium 19S3-7]MCF6803126.1 hypothetical protein [Thiotrichales bacterium 19S3-11]
MPINKNHPVVIFWDFDGPINDVGFRGQNCYNNQIVGLNEVIIAYPQHLKAVFEILSKHNVLSIPSSQRCSYSDSNEQEKSLKDVMYNSFDVCFGERRQYLRREHGNLIVESVNSDSTGRSKNAYFENIGKVRDDLSELPHENIILIDDNLNYSRPTTEAGYQFLHVNMHSINDQFSSRGYLIELMQMAGLSNEQVLQGIMDIENADVRYDLLSLFLNYNAEQTINSISTIHAEGTNFQNVCITLQQVLITDVLNESKATAQNEVFNIQNCDAYKQLNNLTTMINSVTSKDKYQDTKNVIALMQMAGLSNEQVLQGIMDIENADVRYDLLSLFLNYNAEQIINSISTVHAEGTNFQNRCITLQQVLITSVTSKDKDQNTKNVIELMQMAGLSNEQVLQGIMDIENADVRYDLLSLFLNYNAEQTINSISTIHAEGTNFQN